MRTDNMNFIIHYLSLIIDKKEITTEIQTSLIDKLASEFRQNPTSIVINLFENPSDVSSKDWPIYVMVRPYNDRSYILIDKTKLTQYTAEELGAILLHAYIHNVLTTVYKTRFVSTLSTVMDKLAAKYQATKKWYSPDDLSQYLQSYISMRPLPTFYIPDSEFNVTGDEIIDSYDLVTPYNTAIAKFHGISSDLIRAWSQIDLEDFNIKTINDVNNEDLRYGLEVGKFIIEGGSALAEFNSQMGRIYKLMKYEPINRTDEYIRNNLIIKVDAQVQKDCCENGTAVTACNESISMVLLNESSVKIDQNDLRYQMDRLMVKSGYMETESERVSLLMSVRRFADILDDTSAELERKKDRDSKYVEKKHYIDTLTAELDIIRVSIVEKKLSPTRYGVIVQYPPGFDITTF